MRYSRFARNFNFPRRLPRDERAREQALDWRVALNPWEMSISDEMIDWRACARAKCRRDYFTFVGEKRALSDRIARCDLAEGIARARAHARSQGRTTGLMGRGCARS